MKLVSAYANVTLESGLTKDQFKQAVKHCPDSLILRDEDKRPIFALEIKGTGCITSGGVCYDNMTGEGKPFTTVMDKNMPADLEKRAVYLNETYGRIVFLVKKTEDQVTAALAAIASEVQTVADAIVVG